MKNLPKVEQEQASFKPSSEKFMCHYICTVPLNDVKPEPCFSCSTFRNLSMHKCAWHSWTLDSWNWFYFDVNRRSLLWFAKSKHGARCYLSDVEGLVNLTQKAASSKTEREFINKFRVSGRVVLTINSTIFLDWGNGFQRHFSIPRRVVTELLLISADVMSNQTRWRSQARQYCKWGENQPADQILSVVNSILKASRAVDSGFDRFRSKLNKVLLSGS